MHCLKIISDNNLNSNLNLTLKDIYPESLDHFTLCGRFRTKQFTTKRNFRQYIFPGFKSLVADDCDDSKWNCFKSRVQIGIDWNSKHTFGIFDFGIKSVTFKSWSPGQWHSFCMRINNSTLLFNLSSGEQIQSYHYDGRHKTQKSFFFMNDDKNKKSPFHGSMTDINIWNYFLANEEIHGWMKCENSLEKGKLFNWNNLSDPDYDNIITEEAKIHIESTDLICKKNIEDDRLVVTDQNYTFDETYKFCKGFGSMAVASDNHTAKQIVDALYRYNCDRWGAFTGHTDWEEEGNFAEFETGRKINFTNWAEKEPNNGLGGEDCIILLKWNSKMYDFKCSYDKLCQVCNVSEVKYSI